MFTISVFTPTYNRANSIYRVYDSLKKQTFKNFEWILVDDASIDNTATIIQRILAENILTIHHIRFNKNCGKHIAHNRAIEIASGELFTVIDSDDEIVPNALEVAIDTWMGIPEMQKNFLCGMYFSCKPFEQTNLSSNIGANNLITNDTDMQYKLNLVGDRWAIRKTEAFRKYPFPDDFVGHYYPEGIIWKKMGSEFNTIVYSKELYIVHNDNSNSIMRGKRTLKSAAKYVCLVAADDLNNYLKYARYRPPLFVKSILKFFVYSLFTQNPFATWKTLNIPAIGLVFLFLPFNIIGLFAFCTIQIYRKLNGSSAF
jgi:glycosyltransferase involved in cell wall biosynthesis